MPIQIEGRAARSESWVVRRRITESGALDSSLSFLNRFSAGKAVVAAARSQVSSYKPSGCVEQLHSFSRGWPHGPDYKLCNTTHKREWCYVFNKQIVFAKCKTCALVLNLWGGKVKNIKRRFTQHPSKLLHDASDWRCMWRRYLIVPINRVMARCKKRQTKTLTEVPITQYFSCPAVFSFRQITLKAKLSQIPDASLGMSVQFVCISEKQTPTLGPRPTIILTIFQIKSSIFSRLV